MCTDLFIGERTIIQWLAEIHPMDLAGLMAQCIRVLARTVDIGKDHPVFTPLRSVRTPDELARIDWDEVIRRLQFQASLHGEACQCAILPIRLLVDRALLHRQLYLSKSASTLNLLGQIALPPCVKPLELLAIWVEFERTMCEADRALHTGRTLLDHFQDRTRQGEVCQDLRALLEQAQTCYLGYRQAIQRAVRLVDYVNRYLQMEDERDGVAQAAVRKPTHAA